MTGYVLVSELTVCFVCACRGSHVFKTASRLARASGDATAPPDSSDLLPAGNLDYDTDADADLSDDSKDRKIFSGFKRNFGAVEGQFKTPEAIHLFKDPTQDTEGAYERRCRVLFTDRAAHGDETECFNDSGMTNYISP